MAHGTVKKGGSSGIPRGLEDTMLVIITDRVDLHHSNLPFISSNSADHHGNNKNSHSKSQHNAHIYKNGH